MRERPIGVTILAILAGIAAVLAAIHALQFLGIIPFFFSPAGIDIHVRYVSFWYALMYGLLVWVYIWLTTMLWRVEPQAWMFLVDHHHVLSNPRFLLVVWDKYLGGCKRIRHHQCHYPAVLHASRREVSFWYGYVAVHSSIRMQCVEYRRASVKAGWFYLSYREKDLIVVGAFA